MARPRVDLNAGAPWLPGLGVGEVADVSVFTVYGGPTHMRMVYSSGIYDTPMAVGDVVTARLLYTPSVTTDTGTYPLSLTGISDDYGNSWSHAFSLTAGNFIFETWYSVISSPFPNLTNDYLNATWSSWPPGQPTPPLPLPLVSPPYNWATLEDVGFLGHGNWHSNFSSPLTTQLYGPFTIPGLVGVDPGGSWSGGGSGSFGALGFASGGVLQGIIWSALTDAARLRDGGDTFIPEIYTPNTAFTSVGTVLNNFQQALGAQTNSLYHTNTVDGDCSYTFGFIYPGVGGPQPTQFHLPIEYRLFEADEGIETVV